MAKIRNVPFPRPCEATGNDAQKLHAPAFAHFRGAVLRHEVFCPFSAEYTANQAAGFSTKSASFFVPKKFFEIFSFRGPINGSSRRLPIEGQNRFPRDP